MKDSFMLNNHNKTHLQAKYLSPFYSFYFKNMLEFKALI